MKQRSPLLFALALALPLSQVGAAPQGPPQLGNFGPLLAPPSPAGNPITPDKILLGKALFWDEQMSSTRTTSCGTCHIPAAGGSDPRTPGGMARFPGADEVFGNDDDVFGSPGVPRNMADGHYRKSVFGVEIQVTPRKTPTALNAGYSDLLFWDGRAVETLRDPATQAVVLPSGAALESQVLGPPLSGREMAHEGRLWSDVEQRLMASKPLALAENIPADVASFVAGKSYPDLFQQVYGTPEVTATRVAMAVATYERTFLTDQTPFNSYNQGNVLALTGQERRGLMLFIQHQCADCHSGARLTDDDFHYIGVRPSAEDLGRFNQTGISSDSGSMRTPSLLNVELRAPYMHNGRLATLEEVVEFYDRGGDFDAPNKDPRIQPLGLSQGEKNALVAFMRRPLTDPRVASELPPFDRPTLYSESSRQPSPYGIGTPGAGGFTPRMQAVEPPLVGNPNMTLAVDGGLGGQPAVLVMALFDEPAGSLFQGVTAFVDLSQPYVLHKLPMLAGSGPGEGYGSLCLIVPNDPAFAGTSHFAQWFVFDDSLAGQRFATSPGVRLDYF